MKTVFKNLLQNTYFRNISAFVISLFIGASVNMAIIMVSSKIIPPPNGVDVTTMESLQANMHLFKPINFLMPFLAHALGTFVGAFLVTKLAKSYQLIFALIIGIFFFYGGYETIKVLPSPLWFSITDLVFAYLPMAWLGFLLVKKT